MKKSVQAFGKNYFSTGDFPIAVQWVAGVFPQHPFDLTCVPHYHDFSELVVVAGGQGIQMINGESYPVEVGDVFLLNGFTEHFFRNQDGLVLFNLQFDPLRLPLPSEYLRKLPGYNTLFYLEPKLRSPRGYRQMLHVDQETLRRLVSELKTLRNSLIVSSQGFEAECFIKFLGIISEISHHYVREHSDVSRCGLLRMGKVLSLLERDYTIGWSLGELARQACMSVNHFLRLFKEATGESPMSYLNLVRLRHGADLLCGTDLRVSEIALKVGFRDSNYFIKQFHLHYGKSPLAYRQSGK